MQDILVQPSGAFAGALRHSLKRQLLVVIVEHFKAVISAIADALHAQDQIGQLLAVNPLSRENSERTRCRHALFKARRFVPHEVRQLRQENTIGIDVLDGVQGRVGRKDVKGVNADAQIGTVGAAYNVPGRCELIHSSAP